MQALTWLFFLLSFVTMFDAYRVGLENPFAATIGLTAVGMIACKLIAFTYPRGATPRGNLFYMFFAPALRYERPRHLGNRFDWSGMWKVIPYVIVAIFAFFGYLTICALLQKPDLMRMSTSPWPVLRMFVLTAPMWMVAMDVLIWARMGDYERPARVPTAESL